MSNPLHLQLLEKARLSDDKAREKFIALLDLASANADDVCAVADYIGEFPPDERTRYLLRFWVDELLLHYRTWNQLVDEEERIWIRVLQSRSDRDKLKIWILGADRPGLGDYFEDILGWIGIKIDDQHHTTQSRQFKIISAHLQKKTVLKKFDHDGKDVDGALRRLCEYLEAGLLFFFSRCSVIPESWTWPQAPVKPDTPEVSVRKWLAERGESLPSTSDVVADDELLLCAVDMRGSVPEQHLSSMPGPSAMREVLVFCLRFSSRFKSSRESSPISPSQHVSRRSQARTTVNSAATTASPSHLVDLPRKLARIGFPPELFLPLPQLAKLALAARIARRIQPLIFKSWPDIPYDRFQMIERAILAAERWAAGEKNLSGLTNEPPANIVANLWRNNQVRHVVLAVVQAAVDVANAVKLAAKGDTGSLAKRTFTVIKDAIMAGKLAGFESMIMLGIQGDFQALCRAHRNQTLKEGDPVSPDFFGDVWPEGPPPGWPDNESMRQWIEAFLVSPNPVRLPSPPIHLEFVNEIPPRGTKYATAAYCEVLARLENYGQDARYALPFIVKALSDPRAKVRNRAWKAVQAVCPTAASLPTQRVQTLLDTLHEGDAQSEGASVRVAILAELCDNLPALRSAFTAFRKEATMPRQGRLKSQTRQSSAKNEAEQHDTRRAKHKNGLTRHRAELSKAGEQKTLTVVEQIAADQSAIKSILRETVEEHQKRTRETQKDIGVRMGYPEETAASAVSYILSAKSNPTLKSLSQLAAAIHKRLCDILGKSIHTSSP